ncbi:hypothetical protein QVD17_07832 [Tagetes erecta]|uniref:Transmembrane protein n=1 Tax=Tagetes erecta TaxID=13708 RepID=A0AAD8KXC7_TARER|nr:hypothetical protein QVD17_07832 [Tagetes erecta]
MKSHGLTLFLVILCTLVIVSSARRLTIHQTPIQTQVHKQIGYAIFEMQRASQRDRRGAGCWKCWNGIHVVA